MIELRKSSQRGSANFGWLQSRHSFSFGRYYDPAQMGFSALRVINDDQVAPGAGFDTHGHRGMEIISLVLDGVIAHRDSTGEVAELPAGEFQLMSAGRGIMHSEFNANPDKNLHFLQIWIEPDSLGGEPGYQQKPFAPPRCQSSHTNTAEGRVVEIEIGMLDSGFSAAMGGEGHVLFHQQPDAGVIGFGSRDDHAIGRSRFRRPIRTAYLLLRGSIQPILPSSRLYTTFTPPCPSLRNTSIRCPASSPTCR